MNKEDWNKWIQSLPPGAREDMLKGGKTASPMGELAILGATAAAVKALPALLGAGGKMMNKEIADLTISNAARAKGIVPSIKNLGSTWKHLRPWNAFLPRTPVTPGGTLQTLPTKPAAAALGIGGVLMDQRPAIAGGPRLPGESGADPGMGSMSREEVLRWMKDNPGGAKKMWEKWNKLHGGVKLPPV